MSKKNVPKELLILLIIFILIFFLGALGLFKPLRRLTEKSLILPAKQKLYNYQRWLKKDLDGCELKQESQMAELKVKIAALTEENLKQRKLLSSPLPRNWQFIGANVVENFNEEFEINIGKQDGVEEKMTVLLEATYLGKVILVSESLAKVRLPSYPEEKMAIVIVSPENQNIVGKGLLIGKGEGKMKIEQIFSSEEVKANDLVATQRQGGTLLIGQITEVTQSQGEAFKTAQVRLLYNPEELETVFLLRGIL